MANLLSRSQLQAMIDKSRDHREAQIYQYLDEFNIIVYRSGDDLYLLLQPLRDIVNLHGAWKSVIAAWPYQLTFPPFLTKSEPHSLAAKFTPPFVVKRKPGPEKSSELVSVHLQIPDDMYKHLRAESAKSGIAVNEIIRKAVLFWLSR